jgi:hypothetical protein
VKRGSRWKPAAGALNEGPRVAAKAAPPPGGSLTSNAEKLGLFILAAFLVLFLTLSINIIRMKKPRSFKDKLVQNLVVASAGKRGNALCTILEWADLEVRACSERDRADPLKEKDAGLK